MSLFTVNSISKGGKKIHEVREGKDRFEVYAQVRKEGLNVLSVVEKSNTILGRIDAILGRFSRIKESERIVLVRNLGAMVAAGLGMPRAISVMERQTKNQKLKMVLARIQSDIQKGEELSVAMKKHPDIFSPLITSMVKAGEESGTLSRTLQTIAEQMDRTYQLKKKIHGALIYPAIVVIALIIVGILMLVFIVPTLTSTFTELGVELPATTQVIIGVSEFLTKHTLAAIGIMLLVFFGFYSGVRTSQGKYALGLVLLYTPIIGMLVKETNSARTGRTLSSLLSAGVNFVQALHITKEVVQHDHYRAVLTEAIAVVERGEPISGVFGKYEKLYPPLVSELIAVGEETGTLPNMLNQIALFYENEVEQKTKNISTIIEPMLMLLVGGVVGFFAVSMITPIYSITSSL